MHGRKIKSNQELKHLTLRNFTTLAEAAKETGQLQEAEEFFRSAYQGKVKILGRYHPECLTALHDLALVFELKRKFDLAEETFIEAMKSREQVLGKHHPSTCSTAFCLGELYRKLNRTEPAREMYDYAYDGYRSTQGVNGKNTKLVKRRIKLLETQQNSWACLIT